MKKSMNKQIGFGVMFFSLTLSLFGQNIRDFELRGSILVTQG